MFVVGVAVTLFAVATCFFWVSARAGGSPRWVEVTAYGGGCSIFFASESRSSGLPWNAGYLVERSTGFTAFRFPSVTLGGNTDVGTLMVYVPLWLPAVLCLAWPVTSFLLARRRRRRGFPVEPASPPAGPG